MLGEVDPRFVDEGDMSDSSSTGGFEIPLKARFGVSEVVNPQEVIMRNSTAMYLGKE